MHRCSRQDLNDILERRSVRGPEGTSDAAIALFSRCLGASSTFAADDKQSHWIEGTTARFEGYLEFRRRPEPLLGWLADRLSSRKED